jgi:hypothetical protein
MYKTDYISTRFFFASQRIVFISFLRQENDLD